MTAMAPDVLRSARMNSANSSFARCNLAAISSRHRRRRRRDPLDPGEEVGQTPHRFLGLRHRRPREAQLLAIVDAEIEEPQR